MYFDLIVIIIDWLTKIVHYKFVKVTINIISLAKLLFNIVIKHYDILNYIIGN